eukprot:8390992-Alexandrium_andersonii.AAC.1
MASADDALVALLGVRLRPTVGCMGYAQRSKILPCQAACRPARSSQLEEHRDFAECLVASGGTESRGASQHRP